MKIGFPAWINSRLGLLLLGLTLVLVDTAALADTIAYYGTGNSSGSPGLTNGRGTLSRRSGISYTGDTEGGVDGDSYRANGFTSGGVSNNEAFQVTCDTRGYNNIDITYWLESGEGGGSTADGAERARTRASNNGGGSFFDVGGEFDPRYGTRQRGPYSNIGGLQDQSDIVFLLCGYEDNDLDGVMGTKLITISGDRVTPAPSLTYTGANPTAAPNLTFRVTFNWLINPSTISSGDFVVGGTAGGARNVSIGQVNSYTWDITVTGMAAPAGTVTVQLPAGRVTSYAISPVGNSASGTATANWDGVAPQVSNITRLDATPSNASSVRYRVVFDEAVTGVGTSDFTIVRESGSINSYSVTGVSGSGTTYDVTINTGSGDGVIRLDVPAAADIRDALNNDYNSNFNGPTYTIDKTAPLVSSVVRLNPAAQRTNAGSVVYRVTFNESVSGVGTPDFTIDDLGTGITGEAVSGVTGSGTTWDVTVNTGSGDGTLRLDVLPAAGISDAAGNDYNATYNSGQTYIIDKTPATVSSVIRQSPATQFTNAASVVFRVTFNEAMDPATFQTGDFTPTGIGDAGVTNVAVVGGSGDTQFNVTVNTGTSDGVLGLSVLPAATLNDVAGNDYNATYNSGETYTVDKTPPTVSSINRLTPPQQNTNDASIVWRVTFAEPVVGGTVNSADFVLTKLSGDISGMSITGLTAQSSTEYDISASTGSGSGELRLDLPGTATIDDIAGNDYVANYTSGQTYIVDRTDLLVNSSNRQAPAQQRTNAASVVFRVTFNKDIQAATAGTGDFTPEVVSGGPFVGLTVDSVAAAGGDALDVTVLTGTGEGQIRLNVNAGSILDLAGNPLTASFNGGQTYIIDKTAPTISSIARQNPIEQNTNAQTVIWRVVFNEEMDLTTMEPADFSFAVVSGSVSGQSATTITQVNPTTFDVTADSGTGNGELRLDVLAAATINDVAGNDIVSSFQTGQTYILDKTAPAVSAIIRQTPSQQNVRATQVTFAVTFSEAVTGVDSANFTIDATGAQTGAAIGSVSGSGTNWTVTVNTVPGVGTLSVDLAAALGTILDAVGNSVTTAYTAGEIYNVDRQAPTVASITRSSPPDAVTNATDVTFAVTFSEPVTGVAAANFSIDASDDQVAAAITTVGGSGTDWVVTVNTAPGIGDLSVDLNQNLAGITDAVGNAMSATFTGGQLYTIDREAPTPLSIVRQIPVAQQTNAAQVTFLVTFSEAVTGVAVDNFAIDATGDQSSAAVFSVAGSGDTRQVVVNTSPGVGNLSIDLNQNLSNITDAVGNPMSVSLTTGEVYDIDRQAPTVPTVTPTRGLTVVALPSITLTFSEEVSGVVAGDLTVNGNAATTVTTTDNINYTFIGYAAPADGPVSVNFGAGAIVDLIGNAFAGDSWSYTKDAVALTVVLASGDVANGGRTNQPSLDFTIDFSEGVQGFVEGDLSLTNATVSAFTIVTSVSATFAINPSGDGAVSLQLPAGVVESQAVAGKFNQPSDLYSFTYDATSPNATSIVPAEVGPTSVTEIAFAVQFDEPVLGFNDVSDVIITHNGTFSTSVTVSGSGANYTVQVKGLNGTGDFTIEISALSDVTDLTGNPLAGSVISAPPVVIDNTPPTVVSVTTASPSPTNANAITFDVVFDEPVLGFDDLSDLQLVVTPEINVANATISGSGDTYQVQVTGVSAQPTPGQLALAIATSSDIRDVAGNAFVTPAQSAPVVIDQTPPAAVNIGTPAGPTNADALSFPVTFSEDVVGFDDAADVVISHSGTASTGVTITGTGTDYNVEVTGITGDGEFTVAVNLGSDVTDIAGNLIDSSTVSGAVQIDNTPSVIANVIPAQGSTVAALNEVQVTFDTPVSGVAADSLTVNGQPATAVSGSGVGPYGFSGFPAPGGGVVNVAVLPGVIVDEAGNAFAGDNFTYNLDNTLLTATITSSDVAPDGSTNASTVSLRLTFSEAVTGMTSGSLSVTNASLVSFNGVDDVYDFALARTTTGLVSVFIAEDVVESALLAGKFNEASNQFNFRFDNEAPVVLSVVPGTTGPTNADSVSFSVTFSESVLGFNNAADVIVDHQVATSNTGVTISGTGPTRTVQVNGITGNGPFALGINLFSDITDLAGNPLTSPTVFSVPVLMDNRRPELLISLVDPDPRTEPVDSLTISFTEAVNNFDISDVEFTYNGEVVDLAAAGVTLTTSDQRSWEIGDLTPLTTEPGRYVMTVLISDITDAAGNTLVEFFSRTWRVVLSGGFTAAESEWALYE